MTAAKTPETFGAWVRTRRRQLDLTQAELGKRAGCSEAAIRKIEAGERRPSRQLAEILAQSLEIPEHEREFFLHAGRGILPDEITVDARTQANRHNLPTLVTSTIDRKHDLSAVLALLRDPAVHLVTLIGPPGIGKTRLSIHCGNGLLKDFPDGVWFVDLGEIADPDFFLSSLARSLPTLDLPPSPDLPQFLAGLRDRHLLLILDNFEQIVAQASLDVAKILKACPNAKMLVTSRMPLHIYGEQEYAVPALSIPSHEAAKDPDVLMESEAVQLLVARIRQHQLQFKVTSENAENLIKICRILDGIPLALELAAASLRQMSLADMASMLSGLSGTNWVGRIGTPARDLPQRQRTLENVIDWSYALLDDEQKDFFCRLGILSGWFDTDTAAAVCETDLSKVQEILNLLSEHSLLQREMLNGRAYWCLLELIREYAGAKLDPAARNHVEQLRTDYFTRQLQSMDQQPGSRMVRDAYFQNNSNNLLASLDWTIRTQKIDLGFQFIELLDDFWWSLGYMKEGLALVHRLMEQPDPSEPQVRANRLQMAADFAWQQHDFESALVYSQAAVELGRVQGLKDTYPWYLNRLGRIYIEQERFSEAKTVLQECLSLAYLSPEIVNPGSPLAQLGEIALFEGRLQDSKSLLEEALSCLKTDDNIFTAMAMTDLAEIELAQNDRQKAHQWLQQTFEPAQHQIRRLLIFLCALMGFFALSGKGKKDLYRAAQLHGAIESLRVRSGINFNSFYMSLNQKRMQMVKEKLSQKEFFEAQAEGRAWRRADLLAWIKTQLDDF